MAWGTAALALLAAAVGGLAAEEAAQSSTCQAGKEACTRGSVLLQQKVKSEKAHLNLEHEDSNKAEVETRQYEYAGAQISISADSDVALYGRGLWIIMVASGCTDKDVTHMADFMPNGTKANYSGHPSEGGLCVFMMEGTEQEVREELRTHTWPGKVTMEADHPVHSIPEVDEDKNGASLLEEDGASGPGSWGLDRIDDPQGLDNDYSPEVSHPKQGLGVHVYVLDTGINIRHQDFSGRAFSAWTAYPSTKECSPSDVQCGADGHGHGTHCAGTVGGTRYGVAKKASLHGVKVLSDSGSGSTSGIIKAIEFIMTKGHRPAIISMSLGGKGRYWLYEQTINSAVKAGIPVVVAAGNDNDNACNYGPAFVPSAITVGATDKPWSSGDRRAGYSNYGKCVDLFAPGSGIVAPSHTSNTGSAHMSGTSMACPHVSGVAALMMGEDAKITPSDVIAKLLAEGAGNDIADKKADSPSVMLRIGKKKATNNVVEDNAAKVGGWGGKCTCPDGEVLWAGDNHDWCASLACVNGVSGTCNKYDGKWSRKQVTCATNNVVEDNAPRVGGWGGKCTCPDGEVLWAGDNHDSCASLACVNGVSGTCNKYDGKWSRKKVTCGSA